MKTIKVSFVILFIVFAVVAGQAINRQPHYDNTPSSENNLDEPQYAEVAGYKEWTQVTTRARFTIDPSLYG